MDTESVELSVGEHAYDGELAIPEDSETGSGGVIVLPGGGHGPYGGVFDRLTEKAAAAGMLVLRYESWAEPEEIRTKSYGDLHDELDAAVGRLQAEGVEQIHVVGKSFGGGVALTYVPHAVDRVVLWAPAMRVGPEDAVHEIADVPLADLETPPVGPGTLDRIDVPVRILQGTDDEVQPQDASEELADGLPDSDLQVLDGLDHSFDDGQWGEEVVDLTVEWLRE